MTISAEEYDVVQMSPVTSHDAGRLRTGTLGYGWTQSDPLAVTLRVTLALNTFEVNADAYPVGLTCPCGRVISWGAFACQVPGDKVCCMLCGHRQGRLALNTEDWKVGLSLLLTLVSGQDSADLMPGEVQLYRAANGEVVIVLSNRDANHSVQVRVPYENLAFFLKRLKQARGAIQGDLERQYLDSGVGEIEKWLDGVE